MTATPFRMAMPRIPSSIREPTNAAPVPVLRNRRAAGEPTPEDIRVRAYEIFVARGRQPGREAEDWAQAEAELRAGPVLLRQA